MSTHVNWTVRRRVMGYCPVCGRETLRLTDTGYLWCAGEDCDQPFAAREVLADPETEHVVHFEDDGYQVKHPLRERIGDALLTCRVIEHINTQLHITGISVRPPGGLWRVTYRETPEGDAVGWQWEALVTHDRGSDDDGST